MTEFFFNQAKIAAISGVSTKTISRYIAENNIKGVTIEGAHNKKFNISSIRRITKGTYSSTKKKVIDKVQVFYNFKGGTGKTSLCYQVATHLSLLGFKVLTLDLDPQGHLSHMMQIDESWKGLTIYDVLIHNQPIKEAIVPVFEGVDLLPANISMTRIEVPLSTKIKREEKLRNVLNPLKKEYDFIIMDTNPTISTLNMNALVASDRINIVCETHPFSLEGLRVLMQEIETVCSDMDISPIMDIIPNKYEIKTATAQEVLGALRFEFKSYVLGSVVRKSEDINVASKKKLPVAAFCKAKSAAFEDINDLVPELIEKSCNPQISVDIK